MFLFRAKSDRRWTSAFSALIFTLVLASCGDGVDTGNTSADPDTTSGTVQGVVTLDVGASAASLAHAAGVGTAITVAVYDDSDRLLGETTADTNGKYAIPVTVDSSFQEGNEGVHTLRVVATSNGRTLTNYVLADDPKAWGSVYLSPEIEAYAWYRSTVGGASGEELATFAKDNTSNGGVVSPLYQPLAQRIAPHVSNYLKNGDARPDLTTLFGYAWQLLQPDLLAKDSSGIGLQRVAVSGERFAATAASTGSFQQAQSTCGITEAEDGIFTSSPTASGNCYMVFKMSQSYSVLQQRIAQPVATNVLAQTINPQDGATAQAGSILVDIPAYALATAVPVSVNAITSEGSTVLGQPVLQMTGGLEFNLPVRIGVRYADLGISDPRTAVWRTNGGSEPILPVAVEDGVAYFELLSTRAVGLGGATAQSLGRAKAAAIANDFKIYVISIGYISPLYPIEIPSEWSGVTSSNLDTLNGDQYFSDWGLVHTGNDFAVEPIRSRIQGANSLGKKVYPICPGVVTEINVSGLVVDHRIVVSHDPGCGGVDDLVGNYMHVAKNLEYPGSSPRELQVGDRVTRDIPLGKIESYQYDKSGPYPDSSHLHLTLYRNSKRVDKTLPEIQVNMDKKACFISGKVDAFYPPSTAIECDEGLPKDVTLYSGYGRLNVFDKNGKRGVKSQYNVTRRAMNMLGFISYFDVVSEEGGIDHDFKNNSFIVNSTGSMAAQGINFGTANFPDKNALDRQIHQLYMTTGVSSVSTCQLTDNVARFGSYVPNISPIVNEISQGVLRIDANASLNIGGVDYSRLYIDSSNSSSLLSFYTRLSINNLPDLRISSGYKLIPYSGCGDMSHAKLFVSPVTATFPARLVQYSKSVMDIDNIGSSKFRYGSLYYPSGSSTNSTNLCAKVAGSEKCADSAQAVSGNYVNAAAGSKSVFALSLAGKHQLFMHLMNNQTLAGMNTNASINLYTVSNGAVAESIALKVAESPSAANTPSDYQNWYALQRSTSVAGKDDFYFDLKGQAYIVIGANAQIQLDAIRAVSPIAASRANVSRAQTVTVASSAANATSDRQAITATVQVKKDSFWTSAFQSIWKPKFIPIAQSASNSAYQYNVKFNNLEEGQYRVIYSANPALNLQPVVFEFDIAANGEVNADLPTIQLGDKGRSNAAVEVIDSTTNQPVAGATVKFYYGYTQNVSNSSSIQLAGQGVTDASGRVSLANLYNGLYTIQIEKSGNSTSRSEMQVGRDATVRRFISPVLSGNQARAVLRWGQNPSDLDSHLIRYTGTTQDYHIYYQSRNASDANLDVDVTNGFGPETVSFSSVSTVGTYKYVVHQYAGSGSISASGAAVSLTFGSTTREFFPPNEAGIWWHVFDLVNGVIVPCQTGCMAADIDTALRSGTARAASSRTVNAFSLLPKR